MQIFSFFSSSLFSIRCQTCNCCGKNIAGKIVKIQRYTTKFNTNKIKFSHVILLLSRKTFSFTFFLYPLCSSRIPLYLLLERGSHSFCPLAFIHPTLLPRINANDLKKKYSINIERDREITAMTLTTCKLKWLEI